MPPPIPGLTNTTVMMACLTVLCLFSDRSYDEITALLNHNFPLARMTPGEARRMYNELRRNRPHWVAPLILVGPEDPIVRTFMALLSQGTLRTYVRHPPEELQYIVPTNEEVIEGPYWAIERIIRDGDREGMS